jgi:hypothetical protein
VQVSGIERWPSVFPSVKRVLGKITNQRRKIMTAEKKIAQKRLSLLQLVERLHNVSEAIAERFPGANSTSTSGLFRNEGSKGCWNVLRFPRVVHPRRRPESGRK